MKRDRIGRWIMQNVKGMGRREEGSQGVPIRSVKRIENGMGRDGKGRDSKGWDEDADKGRM